MYRACEKHQLHAFSRGNRTLIKVAAVFAIMIQPVLLILGPLPGYLLYTFEIGNPGFWLSALIIIGLSSLSFVIYNSIVKSRYTAWVVHVAGHQHFYIGYCRGQLLFATPTLLLLALGLTKTEQLVQASFVLALVVTGHILFYWLAAQRRITQSAPPVTHRPILQLLRQITAPATMHYLAYLTSITMLSLMWFTDSILFNIVLALVVTLLTTTLAITQFRISKHQLASYQRFLWLIEPRLVQSFNRALILWLLFLLTLPLGIICVLW